MQSELNSQPLTQQSDAQPTEPTVCGAQPVCLWEGFIHPHIDRMNKFFPQLVRTVGTLYLGLLYRLYRHSYLVGQSSLSLFLIIP